MNFSVFYSLLSHFSGGSKCKLELRDHDFVLFLGFVFTVFLDHSLDLLQTYLPLNKHYIRIKRVGKAN